MNNKKLLNGIIILFCSISIIFVGMITFSMAKCYVETPSCSSNGLIHVDGYTVCLADNGDGYAFAGFSENDLQKDVVTIPRKIGKYKITQFGAYKTGWYYGRCYPDNYGNIREIIFEDNVTSTVNYPNFRGVIKTSVPVSEIKNLSNAQCYFITPDEKDGVTVEYKRVYEEDMQGGLLFSVHSGIANVEYCMTNGNIEIPSTYKGNPVNIINEYAFEYAKLGKLTIPGSIKYIGAEAFENTEITVGVFAESIESYLDISFDYISSNPLNNGVDLYIGGEKFTELVIPKSVTDIKKYALCGCKSIESITIPDHVNTIYEYAFYNCENLLNIIFINPKSWQFLTYHASVSLDDPITNVTYFKNYYAQYECKKM